MKDWVPSRRQKKLAELFVWPLVQFFQLMTSWKLAWSWSFLMAYLLSQPLWFCFTMAALATFIGWYLWRDYGDSDDY